MSARTIAGGLLLLAASAGPASSEIPIATVGPMTGDLAVFGDQLKNGAGLAVELINQQGGVLGEELELVVGDDACDPKQAVSVANQMAVEGVVFVAGHLCSGASMPASEVYYDEGVVMMSPASTTPDLTERGMENIFRTSGRDDQQGQVAGEYIAANFGDQRIGIINDKSTYTKGLADEVKKVLNAAGIEEALFESFTAGEQDYTALATRLRTENLDFLYCACHHPEAGLLIRQLREQGSELVMMGGDALANTELWTIAGDAAEGTLMTFNPDPARDPNAVEAVALMQERGVDPSGFTLYTMAAVQAFAQAAEQAGSTDWEAVSAALKSGTFQTVLGEISFDEKGDVSAPGFVVYAWHQGEYDYVQE